MPSPEWYSMGRVKTLDGSGPAILRRSMRSKTTRTLTSAPMNQGSAKGAPRTRKNTTGSKRGTKVIKKPTETGDRQVQDPLVLKQTSVLQPRPKRRRKVIPPSDRILRPRRV
ncbi:hypothetical protein FRC20_002576 [Serendipita sp. 405]|nr:hypothetical protein FRC15_002157 [Serendipita sp. 397]KAG8803880.1 hypothetical protein FRC16_002375 [Serendipita sp. 398]KAG8876012.1 hypothetical protein FRC20_002576 [Serendipita sp. 405]